MIELEDDDEAVETVMVAVDDEADDEYDDDDYDDAPIIRAKWIMDDAVTLAEAATKVRLFADLLDEMAAEGWELREPVSDDYGFLKKTEGAST